MDTQQSVDAAVVPEDDDNLLDWLGNVKAIVSEQDVQMWAEKAFVQGKLLTYLFNLIEIQ